MILVFESLPLLAAAKVDSLLTDCDVLSRKITNFSRSLSTNPKCRSTHCS
jgi:hypothetical protein